MCVVSRTSTRACLWCRSVMRSSLGKPPLAVLCTVAKQLHLPDGCLTTPSDGISACCANVYSEDICPTLRPAEITPLTPSYSLFRGAKRPCGCQLRRHTLGMVNINSGVVGLYGLPALRFTSGPGGGVGVGVAFRKFSGAEVTLQSNYQRVVF